MKGTTEQTLLRSIFVVGHFTGISRNYKIPLKIEFSELFCAIMVSISYQTSN